MLADQIAELLRVALFHRTDLWRCHASTRETIRVASEREQCLAILLIERRRKKVLQGDPEEFIPLFGEVELKRGVLLGILDKRQGEPFLRPLARLLQDFGEPLEELVHLVRLRRLNGVNQVTTVEVRADLVQHVGLLLRADDQRGEQPLFDLRPVLD